MNTLVTGSVSTAASILRKGGVVAFPTETVYGLGADAFSASAVTKVFEAKGRPADNPTIVHCADIDQARHVAVELPESAERLLKTFAPGPITVVVPRRRDFPTRVTAGLDTVAIRIPSHPLARALIRAADTPIAAPSANLSGRPSPTTWEAVHADLDGRIDCILSGELSEVGLESTVVDCTVKPVEILRPGGISETDIRRALSAPAATEVNHGAGTGDGVVRSPGVLHRHYAPDATVVVVESDQAIPSAEGRCAYIGIAPPVASRQLAPVITCASVEEYARLLYRFFRQCEAEKVETIFCERAPETGIGVALNDRINRAATATSHLGSRASG